MQALADHAQITEAVQVRERMHCVGGSVSREKAQQKKTGCQ